MKTRVVITSLTILFFTAALAASGEIRHHRVNDEHKLVFVKGEGWQPKGFDEALILNARRVEKEPVIDGQADDPAWTQAESLTVPLAYGPVKQATLKAVYTEKEVFLLVSWPDPTMDDQHHPWVWSPQLGRYIESPQREDGLLVSFEAGCDWTPSLLSGYVYDFDGWRWLAARTNPIAQAIDAYGHTYKTPAHDPVKYRARASKATWQLKFEGYDADLLTAPWEEIKRIYRFAPISEKIWLTYAPDGELQPSAFARQLSAPKISASAKEISPVLGLRSAFAGSTPTPVLPQYKPVKLTGDAGEVAARGRWADGRWTVEFRRVLETPARTATDVIFSRVTQFSIHVFDHTERVDESSESGRLWLRFEPAK